MKEWILVQVTVAYADLQIGDMAGRRTFVFTSVNPLSNAGTCESTTE